MIVFCLFIICGLICTCFWLLNLNKNLKMVIYNERVLHKSQFDIEERFKNISNEILIRNHNSFIGIAKETFDKILHTEKLDLEKKQNNFLNIINPIKDTLSIFSNKISQIEKERVDSYSDLRRHVQDMMLYQQEIRKETSSLNKALSTPFMSGQWGEMQLKRAVEIAGMMSHCDFFEQQQSEGASRLRPDMIIKLPGNRHIIVDAKAPMDSYMKAMNTGEESFMEAHAKRVREHIKALGKKSYWEHFKETPEFVLMFLPGESFFSSAIKQDPMLIEFGVSENVIVATPITLIALLKAVSFSWRNEAITTNAQKIGEVGHEVCVYLEKLLHTSQDFEKRMHKNTKEYQTIHDLLEQNILPLATKLKNLGIEVSEETSAKDCLPSG